MKEIMCKRKTILFSIALFLIIGIFVSNLFVSKTAATTPEQTITSTLENLGASDAVYTATTEANDHVLVEYHSNSTGYTYCFLQSTGVLWSIDNIGPNSNTSSSSSYSLPLSDSRLRSIVMDFVSTIFHDALIGELEIIKEHDAGYAYKYSIREYYNGMETGSSASVTCAYDGTIRACNVTFGTIFERNWDGSITLRDDSPFIGEEAAIAIALDEVEPHAAQRGCTLLPETAAASIRASENLQYYEVAVDTRQADGYIVGYIVRVDVHSGEITFLVFDQ